MSIYCGRIPGSGLQSILRRSPIAAILHAAWPVFASFGLAVIAVAASLNNRLTDLEDSSRQPFVRSGEFHRIVALPDDPQLTDFSPKDTSIRLKGLVRAGGEKLIQDSSATPVSMVHIVEMVVRVRSESCSRSLHRETFTFERVWEASLLTRETIDFLQLENATEHSGNCLQKLCRHVGQRRSSPADVANLMGIEGNFPNEQGPTNQAIFTVSMLSGKTIRVQSLSDGRVVSIQPLGSDLSKNEVDWLHRMRLPQLVHAKSLSLGQQRRPNELGELDRLFPFDVRFGSITREGQVDRQVRAVSETALELVWQEPGTFFHDLYSDNVFVDPLLNVHPLRAKLVCELYTSDLHRR